MGVGGNWLHAADAICFELAGVVRIRIREGGSKEAQARYFSSKYRRSVVEMLLCRIFTLIAEEGIGVTCAYGLIAISFFSSLLICYSPTLLSLCFSNLKLCRNAWRCRRELNYVPV